MRKKIKKLLTIFLIAILLFTNHFSLVHASELPVLENEISIQLNNILQNTYKNMSHYEEGIKQTSTNLNSNAQLESINNDIFLSLPLDGSDELFKGNIFTLNGNGYYDDKIILGDFSGSLNGDYTIILFKSIYEDSIINLKILVEVFEDGTIIELIMSYEHNLFDDLIEIARYTTSQLEASLEREATSEELPASYMACDEILDLLIPRKWCVSSINNENNITSYVQSNKSFSSTNSNTGIIALKNDLKNFCTNVNSSGTITPNASMQTVLKQTGWKIYDGGDYFYVMHGVANSSTEQLVGITVASIANERTSSTGEIATRYTIVGTCTVSYDKNTKKATLLMDNYGIRLQQPQIAIVLSGGNTYFKSATYTYSLQGSGSLLKILGAINDRIGTAASLWEAFVSYDVVENTNDVYFGPKADQEYVYGGVMKAVSYKAHSSRYLLNNTKYIGIFGLYDTSMSYSSHKIEYKFTGYSLL